MSRSRCRIRSAFQAKRIHPYALLTQKAGLAIKSLSLQPTELSSREAQTRVLNMPLPQAPRVCVSPMQCSVVSHSLRCCFG